MSNNFLENEEDGIEPETLHEATDDGEESPGDEAARLIQLESDLAQAQDNALRAQAEMQNIKRRSDKQIAEARKYATSDIAKDLLNVAENLHRALEAVSEEALAEAEREQLKNLHTGVELTLKELMEIFARNHIERIDPTGQPFDPELHQAVAQVPSAQHEAGSVMDVMQAGYTLHDRLLRPAMVTVATKPSDDTGEPEHQVDEVI